MVGHQIRLRGDDNFSYWLEKKKKKKKKRTKHLQKTKLKIKKRIERISIRIFKTEHSVYLLALGFRNHNI